MFNVGDDERSEDNRTDYDQDIDLLLFGQLLTLTLKEVTRTCDHCQRNDPDQNQRYRHL